MSDSVVRFSNGGVLFAGPDAVKLYAARALRKQIQIYMKTGLRPGRGVTITKMLAQAELYTGKRYVGRDRNQRAVDDLQEFALAMECAIPIEDVR